MENQNNGVLDWSYIYQEKSPEELSQSLLLTSLELETTKLKIQQELRVKDDHINQLQLLLNKAILERDEAQNKYQSLLLDNFLLNHHHRHRRRQTTTPPPHSAISSVEDEPITNCGLSSSDCEDSIVSSPATENPVQFPPPPQPADHELPEKGKLLEAVMKAGPLLQNLLLAGPLPLWRHPPPPIDTRLIPPPPPPLAYQESLLKITDNCGRFNNKRTFSEGSDCSTDNKYQRIALN